jgi:hypothetical protein
LPIASLHAKNNRMRNRIRLRSHRKLSTATGAAARLRVHAICIRATAFAVNRSRPVVFP